MFLLLPKWLSGVTADASEYATKGVLSMKYKDKKLQGWLGYQTLEEFSVNIIVCNYDTTYLQENPQRLGWGS